MIRRLLLMIPTAFLISVIVFLLVRLVPGDTIDVMIAQLSESAEEIEIDREALERKFGLDASLIVQYARFLGLARRWTAASAACFRATSAPPGGSAWE